MSAGIAKLPSLPELEAEYDVQLAALPEALAAFESAGRAIIAAATFQGSYGQESINVGGPAIHTLQRNLLRSAWVRVWNGLNLPKIASAKDKKLWEQGLVSPAPFTLDNLRATFAPYLINPRLTILRGMAEVFADLDPAYKSHEKVKVGVKGLPKRVIIGGLESHYGYGMDKVRDILNALAAYQGKPLCDHRETFRLHSDGEILRSGGTFEDKYAPDGQLVIPARGVWLKRFGNGNGHLFFGPEALTDINRALAEFYGDVLADCPDDDEGRPEKRASTAVSKDLQFYPTPQPVIDRVLYEIDLRGKRVLEPSCGDGRLMVAIKRAGAQVLGCEIDPRRANQARDAGLSVHTGNFLEMEPLGGWQGFDAVVMNPPFYGKHYAKHVRHALRFVKPGGTITVILPATARHDHGLLDDLRPRWNDLPIGSFAESGTNVCTTIATIRKVAA